MSQGVRPLTTKRMISIDMQQSRRAIILGCSVMWLALLFCSSLSAQPTLTPSVSIQTNPPGAEVHLDGNPSVTGISPTNFRYPLAGSYAVTIIRPGYETYRTRILIDPATPFTMSVDLSRKSAAKAAARSLFIPGWGQQYMGERTKGLLFHSLAVVSVGAFLLADNDFNVRRDRWLESTDAFDRAVERGATDELPSLQERVRVDQEEAYDAETKRWAAIGAVGAVWGLSVLDALLFSPVERASYGTGSPASQSGLSIDLGSAGTSSKELASTPGLQLKWSW